MSDSKGEELMKQADRKLNSFSFFSSGNKYEEAAEIYGNAAAQFKITKQFDKAGDAYLQAAEVSRKAKNEMEATDFYTQAAQAYRKVNPEEAIRVYTLAASMHMDQNHFSTAAKIYKSIGELSEEDRNWKAAIDAYAKASDCYLAEDSNASSNQMLLKVAHYSALLEDYRRAIEVYEQVANASLDSQLLSYGVKEHYFKAMLCHLALSASSNSHFGHYEELDAALDKYKSNHPAFEDSRECKFIAQCIKAMQEGEVEKFQDALIDFDSITKLDDWKTSLLLKVKKGILAAENEAPKII